MEQEQRKLHIGKVAIVCLLTTAVVTQVIGIVTISMGANGLSTTIVTGVVLVIIHMGALVDIAAIITFVVLVGIGVASGFHLILLTGTAAGIGNRGIAGLGTGRICHCYSLGTPSTVGCAVDILGNSFSLSSLNNGTIPVLQPSGVNRNLKKSSGLVVASQRL